MQAIQYFLLSMAAVLFVVSGITFIYDLCSEFHDRRAVRAGATVNDDEPVRWRISIALALLAWIPFLLALGVAMMPLHALQGAIR